MKSGAEKFLSIKMVKFCFTKDMANDDFCEPPRRTHSKNPIFIFCLFLGLGHLRGLGVNLGRILGSLFGGGGSSSQGALLTPPPQLKARLAQF